MLAATPSFSLPTGHLSAATAPRGALRAACYSALSYAAYATALGSCALDDGVAYCELCVVAIAGSEGECDPTQDGLGDADPGTGNVDGISCQAAFDGMSAVVGMAESPGVDTPAPVCEGCGAEQREESEAFSCYPCLLKPVLDSLHLVLAGCPDDAGALSCRRRPSRGATRAI